MAPAQQAPDPRLEDFVLDGEISKGSFGVVYKAVRKSDRRVFALKQVKLAGMKRADRQEAIDEARVLAQLSHPNVIKYYSSHIDKEDRLNILMEYASGGNVAQLIKAAKGKGLPEDMVWKILIQSLLGLAHIHGRKIIHRDVKALNLFLDANNNIKIGDFGIARALSDASDFARTILGTPFYLSPELCEDKPYNEKSDVWALGVVLYECCMGRYPFDAQNEGALIRKIMRGQYQAISGPYTTALLQILASLMTFKYTERPNTAALLRHPALQQKAKALRIDLNANAQPHVEDRAVYAAPNPLAARPTTDVHTAAPPAHAFAPNTPAPALPHQHVARAQAPQQPVGPHPFDLAPSDQHRPRWPANPPDGQHPAAMAANSFDRMVDEIERMQLGTAEFNRRRGIVGGGVEARHPPSPGGHAHNQPLAKQDHVRGMMTHPQAPTPVTARLRPEELPPAGCKGDGGRQGAPFALHYVEASEHAAASQTQAPPAWGATYAAPQFGRRRCPELQITGPSLRSGPGVRPVSGRPAGYIAAADDATTYISSSYATFHK